MHDELSQILPALPQPDKAFFASDVFGHVKGAFTGADKPRRGKVEQAQYGTLFLDEIGDLPADLPGLVHQRQFRQDLCYRLTGLPIHLPPLRHRAGDLLLLVRHFAEQFAQKYECPVPPLTAAARQALLAHPWPGNVREVSKVIERAVNACQDRAIEVTDLHLSPPPAAPAVPPALADGASLVTEPRARYEVQAAVAPEPQTLEEREREQIRGVLEQTGWRMSGPQGAAAILGLEESALRDRMQRYGISRPG